MSLLQVRSLHEWYNYVTPPGAIPPCVLQLCLSSGCGPSPSDTIMSHLWVRSLAMRDIYVTPPGAVPPCVLQFCYSSGCDSSPCDTIMSHLRVPSFPVCWRCKQTCRWRASPPWVSRVSGSPGLQVSGCLASGPPGLRGSGFLGLWVSGPGDNGDLDPVFALVEGKNCLLCRNALDYIVWATIRSCANSVDPP